MNELAQSVLYGVLMTTLYLTVGTLVVAVLLHWLRVTSPRIARLAWCTPILLAWMFLNYRFEVPWHSAASGDDAPPEASTDHSPLVQVVHGSAVADAREMPTRAGSSTPLPAAVTGNSIWQQWPIVIVIGWLLGMIVVAVRAGASYVHFVRRVPRDEDENEAWRSQWKTILRSAGVSERIPLVAAENWGPALCRLPRGYVLLVPDALWHALSAAQRQTILRHELAHYQRGDVWKSLALRTLTLPHWFNPFAAYAVRRFDECGELACDEAAVRGGAEHVTDYAKALVALGHVADASRAYSPAARGHSLAFRVKRLLAGNRCEDSVMKKSILLVAMAVLVIGSVVRFELVAQEAPGGGEALRGNDATEEDAQDDAAERLDQARVFVGENFFAVAVTTPLQRLLLGKYNDHEPVAYLNVNAKSFLVPGTGLIDSQALDVSELGRALGQIAEIKKDGHLRILINYGYSPPHEAHRNVASFLKETFEGMGRSAGFSDVRAYSSVWNDEDSVWAPIMIVKDADDAVEENVGTESLQVYPVRTSLSRYFTDDADCYVRLDSPPLDMWDEAYQQTVRRALEGLGTDQRGKVNIFILMPTGDGDPGLMTQEELLAIQEGLGFEKDAVGLMQDIGFEEVVIRVKKGATEVSLALQKFHK